MPNNATLYDLLRVPKDASSDDIRTAFEQRIAELEVPGFLPPSLFEESRSRLQLAFETLGSVPLRAAYDARLERMADRLAESRDERRRSVANAAETPAPSRLRYGAAGLAVLGLAAAAFYAHEGRHAARVDPQHDQKVLQAAEERLDLQAFFKETGKRAASRDEMELLRRQISNDERTRNQSRLRAESEAKQAEHTMRNANRRSNDSYADDRAEAKARADFMRDKEEEDAMRRRSRR